MKFLLIIFCLIIVHPWTFTNAQQSAKESNTGKKDFVFVDARKRATGSDGKIAYTAYTSFKTRTVALLPGYTMGAEDKVNSYGGLPGPVAKATGFFYVKKIEGRWWGIDPYGCRYINVALNSISMGKSDNNQQALLKKFGSPANWISETIKMLQLNGFNCAGSWSDTKAITEANKNRSGAFAYTINWNFMSSYGKERGGTYQQPGHTGYPKDAIFVFDPEFEVFCDRHAKQIADYKDDPNLFGHFSDNEMPFKFKAIENFLDLPDHDPGLKAAVTWLESLGISREQITDKHREMFMAFVADKYFSIVSKAIKKYDPNHMYIGARFYSNEKNYAEFMRTAGKYLDIISNNYYNYWTPDSAQMANWTNWSGRPFIITEYYTKGEDSGMPNQSGAGWIVRTQRDRGLFYQNYNLGLLESKNCVGWHYFKYQDNDPTAKGVDPSNIDANKGVVNNDYEVWEPMMLLMKELNTRVYSVIQYFDGKK